MKKWTVAVMPCWKHVTVNGEVRSWGRFGQTCTWLQLKQQIYMYVARGESICKLLKLGKVSSVVKMKTVVWLSSRRVLLLNKATHLWQSRKKKAKGLMQSCLFILMS